MLAEAMAETLFRVRMMRDDIAARAPARLPTAKAAVELIEQCAELVFFSAMNPKDRAIFVHKLHMANDLMDSLAEPLQ